jgi:hypothetical protein
MVAKDGNRAATDQLAWDFLNDLVDQRLRIDINQETGAIRELIVAQAFSETDLIDDRGQLISGGGEARPPGKDNDPEGIQTWQPAS